MEDQKKGKHCRKELGPFSFRRPLLVFPNRPPCLWSSVIGTLPTPSPSLFPDSRSWPTVDFYSLTDTLLWKGIWSRLTYQGMTVGPRIPVSVYPSSFSRHSSSSYLKTPVTSTRRRLVYRGSPHPWWRTTTVLFHDRGRSRRDTCKTVPSLQTLTIW